MSRRMPEPPEHRPLTETVAAEVTAEVTAEMVKAGHTATLEGANNA